MKVRNVIVLGATGSVGTQALEVIAANPARFAVTGIGAGANIDAAVDQAIRTEARALAIATPPPGGEAQVSRLLEERAEQLGAQVAVETIFTGPEASARLASEPADVVLNAVTGAAGLTSTLAALQAGTDVALANKESLIIGGELVLRTAEENAAQLIPVDSEHSAIAQALRAGRREEVARLIITASGGPFRGMSADELAAVTPEQALAHPTWNMGTVITTNSATLVNKGLEVIEAHLLFGIDYDRITAVVHPQSRIHSMVEFVDGSTIAQVSPPDMKLPIAYALGTEPDGTTIRIKGATAPEPFDAASSWTFEPVDDANFPALRLAVRAGRAGGTTPAVYNAANEELVAAFHAGTITFPQISRGIAAALDQHLGSGGEATELTLETVLAADRSARAFIASWLHSTAAQEARA
ncbi:1-deoxy-D-xylulose-5-phosphate reductoisomerase [Brevibacterium sp. p3-SID960]|uniref:1-deoxy-D-xylulose-5-phosphate reductoisomerase n=1 Tax=Brevibacterium sp. p3-SID960 TaxID=2916063 RepID=UPI0021A89D22|nr:1-deoxy-D-xylulose-5-phosphate reductoisomerase [Brevibacterium sp. p3-SID960]MCT1691235.1 1-deoxy-D-xylulose-5-phosphate reductoisomerase [Brevibacterium sp. p3-SID960]